MNSLGNREIFSRNLDKYIRRSGRTKADIAKDLGLRYTTLNNWIRGDAYPRIDAIEKLANYFNISKVDLIEDSYAVSQLDQYLGIISKLHDNEDTLRLMKSYILLSPDQQKTIADIAESMKK